MLTRGVERRRELGSPVEGVGTFAGLDLGELADDLEPFILGKASDGLLLRFKAKAGAALLLGGDTVVGNQDFMHITITYVPSYICDRQPRLSTKTH